MLIAQEKKKNNIAEYILYMWQIEDIIRANDFDMNKIRRNIIAKFDQPKEIIEEMNAWYNDLISKMKVENIEQKGHLGFIRSIVQKLEDLHQGLIKSPDELDYIEQYNWAKENIRVFRSKTPAKHGGDIETCLNGLYALLLMRLKKEDITTETLEAMSTFSNLLAMLSKKYKEQQKD